MLEFGYNKEADEIELISSYGRISIDPAEAETIRTMEPGDTRYLSDGKKVFSDGFTFFVYSDGEQTLEFDKADIQAAIAEAPE